MDLVIYGAQAIALGAYRAIHQLYPSRKILCFLVTEYGANPRHLGDLKVVELDSFAGELSEARKDEIEVLIATPEGVMPEIEKELDKRGMHCHVRLTSSHWAQLMAYYYACDRSFIPLSVLPIGYNKPSIDQFMAKFYRDKPLTGQYDLPEYVTPIQVGAVLCEERVADILDSDGTNISHKNVNYSELTALYWMWKNRLLKDSDNDKCKYYGLVHYRRVLELSKDDILRLVDNDVDVVLPFPMPYEPNIEEHHKRYLKDADWNALLTALEEVQPEYAKMFPMVLSQPYMYNYNIVLARKEVLQDYCEWLFPILDRVEKISVPPCSDRADRYIGYMGETLETLYFMTNRERLNITYTGCKFLI